MQIHTIEEDFEYQMKQVLNEMRRTNDELKDLEAEELQDKLWGEYSEQFAHAVLERCNDYSGDELFERG